MKELIRTDTGKRYMFIATFDGHRISANNRGISQQLVFRDIKDIYGNRVAKFISFDNIKTFSSLQLVSGDMVSFYARVLEYEEAYANAYYSQYYPEVHYRLFYPTRAMKLVNPVKSTKVEQKYMIHINAR